MPYPGPTSTPASPSPLQNEDSILAVLKESTSLVVGGTTGLRTWEAALHLLEWVIANPAAVATK